MRQRSSFSIVTLVLESAHEAGSRGISRTKIMQNVILNYKRASRYCTNLVDKELLSYDPEKRTFHITEKGEKVLESFHELAGFIAPINEMINKYRFTTFNENQPWDLPTPQSTTTA